jgi:hypothetical protein
LKLPGDFLEVLPLNLNKLDLTQVQCLKHLGQQLYRLLVLFQHLLLCKHGLLALFQQLLLCPRQLVRERKNQRLDRRELGSHRGLIEDDL